MSTGWLMWLWQLPGHLVERLRRLVDSILPPASGASPLLHASAYAINAPDPAPQLAIVTHETNAAKARTVDAELQKREQFWSLQAPPDLIPANYQTLFTLLQRLPGPKVLDLTLVRLLSVDIFDVLARGWAVSGEKVPRLALVFSFERWVMFLRPALEVLHPIVGCGVEVAVGYKEQLTGGQLADWFAGGELRHNAPAAIATLRRGWQPDASWPNVVHTLADLVREHSQGHEAAVLLTELAALALQCGGPEVAVPLSRAALLYLHGPSATHSKALRHLGAALVRLGKLDEGAEVLDLAIATGVQSDRPVVAANPLYQRGQLALDQSDDLGAERRFRAALTLLQEGTGRRTLLRNVHRGLAIALSRQGQAGAAHHARQAIGLHQDPNSEQAALDRQLLAALTGARDGN